MAVNPTPRRRYGVAFGVVLTGVTAGLIGFAGTAGAHTNRSFAECKNDKATLSVDLTFYNDREVNTVKVTDNGKVLHDGEFGKTFQRKFEAKGDVAHVFVVDVVAGDDPKEENNRDKWTFDAEYKVAACVTVTQPPATSSTSATPTSEAPTSEAPTSEAPAPTSSEVAPPSASPVPTTPAPAAQEEVLAETGASIALPLGIAGFLIVGGVGALFVVRRRGKA